MTGRPETHFMSLTGLEARCRRVLWGAITVSVVVALGLLGLTVKAQDALTADASHFKLEKQSQHGRVIRLRLVAGNATELHMHPPSFFIYLTDSSVVVEDEAGQRVDKTWRLGQVEYYAGGSHVVENAGGSSLEVLIVELSGVQ